MAAYSDFSVPFLWGDITDIFGFCPTFVQLLYNSSTAVFGTLSVHLWATFI